MRNWPSAARARYGSPEAGGTPTLTSAALYHHFNPIQGLGNHLRPSGKCNLLSREASRYHLAANWGQVAAVVVVGAQEISASIIISVAEAVGMGKSPEGEMLLLVDLLHLEIR